MKSKIRRLSLPLIGVCFFMVSYSFSRVGVNHGQRITNAELIVQVPKCTEKEYPGIKQALTTAGGISYQGYCSTNQLFLLVVDRNLHPDDSFLDPIFKPLGYDYYIKTGRSINTAISQCEHIIDRNVPVLNSSGTGNSTH